VGCAATFDADAILQQYTFISDEARAKHNRWRKMNEHRQYQGLSFWAPTINLIHDPRWGRTMESWGEDPFLTSVLGTSAVRGLQGNDPKFMKALACAKHFGVHSGPENTRRSANVNPSKRDLAQTYFPHFEALVRAGVQEVMCALSAVNGQPACANDLLHNALLSWGFDGFVVTDCDVIPDFVTHHRTHPDLAHAVADAVKNGTQLDCGSSYKSLVQAVQQGLISRAKIDEAVSQLFKCRIRLGLLDPVEPFRDIPYSVVCSEAHNAHATKVAHESIVLLKNNGALPLKRSQKVLVAGPSADGREFMWGSYNGQAPNTGTIYEGIMTKVASAAYVPATHLEGKGPVSVDLWKQVTTTKSGSEIGYKFEGWQGKTATGPPVVTGTKRRLWWIDEFDASYIGIGGEVPYVGRFTGFFHCEKAEELHINAHVRVGISVAIDGKVVFAYRNVTAGGTFAPFQFSAGTHEIVVEYSHDGGHAEFWFSIERSEPINLAALTAAAGHYDVVVFVGGIQTRGNGQWQESEGHDRATIELPAIQTDALKAFKASGKPVVLVLCGGSALAFPWEAEHLDAILEAWYPGQNGGIAVADVLFGDYNPGGRLPLTFYKATSDLPPIADYAMEGRTYRYFSKPVLYPFGHGLSYTTFEYGTPKLECQFADCGISFSLKNTGHVLGEEVPQVYVKSGKPKEPIKALKGFKRVAIVPGDTIEVRIPLPESSFQTYDEAADRLVVVSGEYQVCVGSSSLEADGRCVTLTLK
jgi:beta-glucosidase